MGIVLIVPVDANDPVRDSDERMKVGIATERSCYHSIQIARKTPNARILLTGCEAGPDFGNATMAEAMSRYITGHSADLALRFHKAQIRDLISTVLAVTEYVTMRARVGEEFDRIIFTERDPFGPMVRAVSRRVFEWKEVRVPYEVRTHKLPSELTSPLDLVRLPVDTIAYLASIKGMREARAGLY